MAAYMANKVVYKMLEPGASIPAHKTKVSGTSKGKCSIDDNILLPNGELSFRTSNKVVVKVFGEYATPRSKFSVCAALIGARESTQSTH